MARFPFLSRRVTAPIVNRRPLRVEGLEDRSVPSTVYADVALIAGTAMNQLPAGVTLVDRDASGTLTNGDAVQLSVNGTQQQLTFGQATNAADAGSIFSTVQQAVTFATAGDTLDVLPGTYNETIDLTKNLTVAAVNTASGAVNLNSLTLNGTAGADTFTVNGNTITVSSGGGTTQSLTGITLTSLTLNGAAGNDTFNVTPAAGLAVTVNGDLPGPTASQGSVTGDTLNLNLGGLTPSFSNLTLSSTTGFGGTVSFGGGAGNVTFAGVERLANGATISGRVFNDADSSGAQNGTEAGLAGVPVTLTLTNNGTTVGTLTTTTDASGNYSFPGLPPGTYTVTVTTGAGQTQTTTNPQPITATLGGTTQNVNFGLHTTTGTGGTTSTITGFVYSDVNRNGTFDTSGTGKSEHGVGGVTVFLDLNGNGRLDQGEPSDVTDSTGAYTLTTTATGTGVVRVVKPTGFIQVENFPSVSLPVAGGTDSNVNVGLFTNLPPQSTPARRFADGIIVGGRSHVEIRGEDGEESEDIDVTPFVGTALARVAFADVTGDGVEDVIVGSGPGVPNKLVVLNGTDLKPVFTTNPFESTYTGGIFVAAGDLTGDGIDDIIVTPDEGGGARVEVFQGGPGGFPQVANFLGIDDVNFRGGARVTIADVNADGVPDLIIAAGFGGGPRVSFLDGSTILAPGGKGVGHLRHLLNDIFVFEQTLRNGVFVGAGDFDGDGLADLVAGGGPGGGPRVLVLSGKDLLAGKADQSAVIANFFAGDDSQRGGVRVSVKDIDGDGDDDLLTGDGTGDQVQVFNGKHVGHGNGKADMSFRAGGGKGDGGHGADVG